MEMFLRLDNKKGYSFAVEALALNEYLNDMASKCIVLNQWEVKSDEV